MKHPIRALALVVLAGCSIDNALVGGRCADGFSLSGDTCMADPTSAPPPDVIHPGNPDGSTDGSPGITITGLEDGGRIADASGPDANPTDDTSDASVSDADVSDASTDDASVSDADVADASDAGVTDASVTDASVTDASVTDASVSDAAVCAPPLIECRGACISVSSDPLNCGACGKICPSNICVNGACQGTTFGDIVLVGHDFVGAWTGSAQAKILSNAMSIPTTDPIRVLSYETDAESTGVAQVRRLISEGVQRTVSFTVASADDLTSPQLSLHYDIVLLHDGSSADPVALGTHWRDSLPLFTQRGGVVVALDGAYSHMPELVTSAGLLDVPGHVKLASDVHLVVDAPADVVGTQVLSPYAPFGGAVAFPGFVAPADASIVVREDVPSGAAVVVHRVVRHE